MPKERLHWFALVGGLLLVVILMIQTISRPPSQGTPSVQLAKEGKSAGQVPVKLAVLTAESRQCLDCHQTKGITPSAIRDWQLSTHASNSVGCEKCHLPAADAGEEVRKSVSACTDQRVRAKVSARNCAPCHAAQVDQFHNGKHAMAWVAMTAMPMYEKMPPVIAERGCGACHNIGRDDGKCNSCHTRHVFATAEARRPEACQTCHMGFDHPQWEMYSTSKHGSIYRMEGEHWDWNKKLGNWFKEQYAADSSTPRTPTCAYCHMPSGDHTVNTAWGFLAVRLAEKDPEWAKYRTTIFKGLGVIDEAGQPTERFKVVAAGKVARTTAEDWEKQRMRELNQCTQCHGASFAKTKLDQADQVIKESDKLMAEAVEEVDKLYVDGILPRPKDRPPHADLLQFYEVENPIEQTLYTMFLEHRMRTFQGAFHMNPDYLHWYGWAEMRRDLAEIKAEAKKLRKEKEK